MARGSPADPGPHGPRSGRPALLAAASLCIGLLLAGLLAELVLRVSRPPQAGFHLQPCIYETDPVWGYRYRPGAEGVKERAFDYRNAVRINSLGFHDAEREVDAAGRDAALRVAVLGDSFTASIHVPIEQTWTRLLESRLRESLGRPVEVFNLGIDGTGSDVHLAVLERTEPGLRPDAVVLAFLSNDIEETERGVVFRECHRGFVVNYQTDEQRLALRAVVDAHAPGPGARWIHDHVYLSRLAPWLFGAATHALLSENYLSPSRFGVALGARAEADEPARIFERFLRLAERRGFVLVVLPMPLMRAPGQSLAVLRASLPGPLLERLDVVDVSAALSGAVAAEGLSLDDLYWERDAHLDADGNRLLADAAAAPLAERLRGLTPRGGGGR